MARRRITIVDIVNGSKKGVTIMILVAITGMIKFPNDKILTGT